MSNANISPINHTFEEAFKDFLQRSIQYVQHISISFNFSQKCSMYGVCIVNHLNYSTYDSYRTSDGIVHTFTTNNYSMRRMSNIILVPGHVQHSLPILSEYYRARGMYDSSSDGLSSENELKDQNRVAPNSNQSSSPVTSTSAIDMKQSLVESTSDLEGMEYITTDPECWSSSPSSLSTSLLDTVCTSTSEYTKPTYHDLLD